MNILCKLGLHKHSESAYMYCDEQQYLIGKMCPKCKHKKINDWGEIARVISQAYTDGKMTQLLKGYK